MDVCIGNRSLLRVYCVGVPRGCAAWCQRVGPTSVQCAANVTNRVRLCAVHRMRS